MSIAACMIVRNSEAIIEKSIDSIRPFVDEINVFDTGSTDGTVALLRKLNRTKTMPIKDAAGVLHKVPLAPIRVKVAAKRELAKNLSADGLLGDFSWAREQSFAMASPEHDWFFWLDDDDIVIGAEHLRPLANAAHYALDGYVFYYDYARDPDTGQNVCSLWRERLIRRKDPSEWGWRNPVHEVWLPHEHTGIVPNYMMLPPEQAHFRHERPDGERYASTRNLVILQKAVADAEAAGTEPDPRTLVYMGTEHMAHQMFAEAIPWLQRYLEHPGAQTVSDERSQVHHKLAMCLRFLGQPQAAIGCEFQGIHERDTWAENAIGLCECFGEIGDWERSIVWGKRALELGMPQSMLILNPLEFTLVPMLRIAQALVEQKEFDEAKPYVEKAAQIMPSHPMVQETLNRVNRDGFREGVVQAVLKLRETLVRFDENQKAYELLQHVPYIVEDDPRIVSARAMQTENVMHMLKPEEYTRWYEDEPKESTVPDEWVKDAGEAIERAKFLLELAQKFEEEHGRKPRMLDLGCNDAWLNGYLWLNGEYVCDGVELNKASVEKAAGRIERFGIPGKIVQGNLFDAKELLAAHPQGKNGSRRAELLTPYDIVSCFEVYEHVPDTERLLGTMESLLSENGIACVTTPNGAFEDGNLQMWQLVERKGHLRAVTYLQLAGQLAEHGRIVDMKVHQDARLTFAAWKPSKKKGRVHLYAPGAFEPWSPLSIKEGGIGGSETCLTYLAVGLSERDWDVRVFADAEPGIYVGSLWRPSAAFDPTEEADAIIVSRAPHAFDVELHAPVRALWCHDATYADQLTAKRAERITDLIALSDWAEQAFIDQYPFLEGKTRIIRNGVPILGSDGEEKFPRGNVGFHDRAPMCIYSSSADRGLDLLLEWWPEIRAIVPNAELHVFYGWETLDKAARMRPELFQFKAQVLASLERAGGEEGGVFMRGRVGQTDLYEAMQDARVWTYPTYFTETSCITAMEARAAGIVPVTSELAALTETVGENGLLLEVGEDGRPDEAYRETFVGLVTTLLTDEELWTKWHNRARMGSELNGWPYRIDEWEALVSQSAAARVAA